MPAPRPAPRPAPAPSEAPAYSLTAPPSTIDDREHAAKLIRVHDQLRTAAIKGHGGRATAMPPRTSAAGGQLAILVTRAVSLHGHVECMSQLRAHYARWQVDRDAANTPPRDVWASIGASRPAQPSTAMGGSGWGSHETWAAERKRDT